MQVRKVCGRPELESSSGSSSLVLPASLAAASTRPSGAGGPHLGLDGRPILSVPQLSSGAPGAKATSQLHAQFGNFMASVVRSRTFYGTLADTICEEYPDKTCWNGERIGE